LAALDINLQDQPIGVPNE
jgi:hypothetical protein